MGAKSLLNALVFLPLLSLLLAPCLGSETPCSLLIDDFISSTPSYNRLGGRASSNTTMTERARTGALELTPLSDASFYLTKLGAPRDLSDFSSLRIQFEGSLPVRDFHVRLHVGSRAPGRFSSIGSRQVHVSRGSFSFASAINRLTVLFSLESFGFSSKELKRVSGVELVEYGTDMMGVAFTLVKLDFVRVECLSTATTSSTDESTAAFASHDDYHESSPSLRRRQTTNTITIDSCTDNANLNDLGGWADDDGTCAKSYTSGGISLTSVSECYYYTLFPSCYTAQPTWSLRVSLTSPPSTLSFLVGLQVRDTSTCKTLSRTYTVSTGAYTTTTTGTTTTITIPLADFQQQGAALNKLHGVILGVFNQPTTIRRIDFLTDGTTSTTASPSTAAPTTTRAATTTKTPTTTAATTTRPTTTVPNAGTIVIDDFSSSSRFASYENAIGGYTDDDDTCTKAYVSTGGGGVSLTKLTDCYFYSLFPSCYSVDATWSLRISLTLPLSSSAASSFSFLIGVQDRNSNCNTLRNTFTVTSSSYSPVVLSSSASSTSLSFTVPFRDFSGATLSKLHGVIFSSFSSKLTINRIEIITTTSTPAPTSSPSTTTTTTRPATTTTTAGSGSTTTTTTTASNGTPHAPPTQPAGSVVSSLVIADFENSASRRTNQSNLGTTYYYTISDDDIPVSFSYQQNGDGSGKYSLRIQPLPYGYFVIPFPELCYDVSGFDSLYVRYAAAAGGSVRVRFQSLPLGLACNKPPNVDLLDSQPVNTYVFQQTQGINTFVEAVIPFSRFGNVMLRNRSVVILFDWWDTPNNSSFLIDEVKLLKHDVAPVAPPFYLPIMDTCGTTGEKLIVQTFDGPVTWNDTTLHLLDLLDDVDIKATFFWAPAEVEFQEKKMCDLAKEILRRGHLLGPHSWYHDLQRSLSWNDFMDEVNWTDSFFMKCLGKKMDFYRPPFGELLTRQAEVLAGMGKKLVLWNLDTLDWYLQNDAKSIQHTKDQFEISRELNGGKDPNSIILLSHDALTGNALRTLVPYFKGRGYRYVTADECYAKCSQNGVGGCYDPDNPSWFGASSLC